MAPRPELVNATAAYLRDLPPVLRTSPEALLARRLAATVAATTSARDIATVSKELRATLDRLRALAADVPVKGDLVDDLKRRRDERRAAAAG
jgi:hypothetical protein